MVFYLIILEYNTMGISWIHHNKILAAMLIYLFIFSVIHILKPSFLYNEDGSIKMFGLGYRNKTVLPIWLISICLAILAYTTVIYFTNNYR